MKKTNTVMDFTNDKVNMLGQDVDLKVTKSGHYCINLIQEDASDTILISFEDKTKEEKLKMAKMFHHQFGHGDYRKIVQLVKDAGIEDDEMFNCIKEVQEKCDMCKRFKKQKLRPVVGFTLSKNFNDVVAMDLKDFENVKIMHMIDLSTRFSAGVIIKSKKKEVIIDMFFKHWVAIFGSPRKILSDNGGEFNNELFRDLANLINAHVLTTSAESPWQNGVTERHNAIIGNMMTKFRDESNCSLEIALAWSLSAKNSLANVYGYSPNQLLFGKKTNLPNILDNDLPALEETTSSQLIAEHLNALHSARENFIKSESSAKLKRALLRKTRTATSLIFETGDFVFYKRKDSPRWRGPGTVIGKDGKQVFVKHGGTYLRVNPCHLQHVNRKVVSKCKDDLEDYKSCSNPTRKGVRNEDTSSDEYYEGDVEERNQDALDQNDDVVPEEDNVAEDNQDVVLPDGNVAPDGNLQNQGEAPFEPEEYILHNGNPMPLVETEDNAEHIADVQENEVETENAYHGEISNVADNGVVHDEIKTNPTIVRGEIPQKGSRISFDVPVTNERIDVKVIGRGGKATGKYKCWMNLQNLKDGSLLGVDLASLKGWKYSDEEVLLSMSQTTNSPDAMQAKKHELDNWIKHKVYSEVVDEGQHTISTRWVLTEKCIDGEQMIKARLVARGFEEKEKQELRKDSPTVSKENVRIMLTITSSLGWKIKSLDVKSAFLQGNTISRKLYLKPPVEAGTNKIWALNKSVYGLCDASRIWYLKVKEELIKTNAKVSKYDPALFFWKYKGDLHGILAAHVDDFLHAGSYVFQIQVIDVLKEKFLISKESTDTFKHLGLKIEQQPSKITLHQSMYIDDMESVKIDINRKNHEELNHKEYKELQAIIGQLCWTANQTRPDISFDTCQIGVNLKDAKVEDLRYANKTIKKLKSRDISLSFHDIGDLSKSKLVTYSDASYRNLKGGASQGGFIIFWLGDNNKYVPLMWSSRKIRRVVKSTLAAETLAFLEAIEHCFLIRTMIKEILEIECDITALTDNKSLKEAAYSTKNLEDKRLTIDMGAVRDMLLKHEIAEIKWIEKDKQLADPLTKKGAPIQKLLQALVGETNLF